MSSGRPKCCSVIAASAVPRTIPRAEDSTAGTEHSGDAPAVANPQPSGCEPAAECCGGTFRSQLAHAQAHTLRRRCSSVQVRFSNRRESKVLAPKAWRSARGAGSAWRFRPSQKPMVKYSFRRSPIRKEFDISQCEGSCIEPEICATGISSLSIPRVEQGPPTTVVKAVIGLATYLAVHILCAAAFLQLNGTSNLTYRSQIRLTLGLSIQRFLRVGRKSMQLKISNSLARMAIATANIPAYCLLSRPLKDAQKFVSCPSLLNQT